ncbi:histidinol-phosphatase [Pontibacter sp. G13]|uniref:histidinol-phosphatase n=1 Tax=Pontibacter sp. G13 TaxID=3074898 RepID=UPI00288971EE|nr:histidinol-phosphatase [Pontibacter sp. G13]WNJ20563.1 histidinol-phosphatase [Pontibacter sp. G13]
MAELSRKLQRMSWTNYHSHSHYCDGKLSPEAHIQSAIERGFAAFGCSSHSPVAFPSTWNMNPEDAPKYAAEIRSLRDQYQDQIEIYVGMEVDFIPGVTGPSDPLIAAQNLDYSVGSIHYVDAFPDGTPWEIDGPHVLFVRGVEEIFGGNARAAVERYYELTRMMVEQDPPSMIGHLDKIKIQDESGKLFDTGSDWYQAEVRKTLDVIAQSGIPVEVNTRGMYKGLTTEPYPGRWILTEMYQRNIPVVLNSDSHRPQEIDGHFSEAAALLLEIGYRELQVLLGGTWQSVPFDASGLKIGANQS